MKLDAQKTALSVGAFISLLHVGWSLLVASGYAARLVAFILWAHMIDVPYRVLPFSVEQAVILVVVVFFVGYAGGWIFATVWNYFHKK